MMNIKQIGGCSAAIQPWLLSSDMILVSALCPLAGRD